VDRSPRPLLVVPAGFLRRSRIPRESAMAPRTTTRRPIEVPDFEGVPEVAPAAPKQPRLPGAGREACVCLVGMADDVTELTYEGPPASAGRLARDAAGRRAHCRLCATRGDQTCRSVRAGNCRAIRDWTGLSCRSWRAAESSGSEYRLRVSGPPELDPPIGERSGVGSALRRGEDQ
jgi:hypothetical protein